MVLERRAVGVDLGAQSLKVVELKISGGTAALERSVRIDRAVLEREGVIGSDRQASADARRVDSKRLARVLKSKIAAHRLTARGVGLAVDGTESILRYTHSPPMAPWRLAMAMKFEVDSVQERMGEAVASDFRVLPLRRQVDEQQTILLGLAKEGPLLDVLEALETAGITVAAAVPAPLALCAAWDLFATKADPDAPEDELVLLADLGATSLNMALILNGRLAFARSVRFGGENFTAALAEGLNLETDDAERLKIACGGLQRGLPGVSTETVAPLRGVSGQLVGLLQSSFRFCSSQTGTKLPPLSSLWLTGGGMRLRGLPSYLASSLGGKPVEIFDPGGKDEPDGGSDTGSGGSLALGLGLSSIVLSSSGRPGGNQRDKGIVSLNILPKKYQERRKFRERTFFLYAAAACLVLSLVAQASLALIKSGSAADTLTVLQSKLTDLQGYEQRMLESSEASRMTRARLQRLLKETEPVAFQAFVLDFMARHLRTQAQIQRVNLETVRREDGSGYDYVLAIEGRINNAKHKGREWFRQLRSDLSKHQDRIRRVRVRKAELEGAWYVFEIAVEPNTVSI